METPAPSRAGSITWCQVSDRILFRKDWVALASLQKRSEAVNTYNARERSDRAEGVTPRPSGR